jgi:hypothetical protein
MNQPPSLHASLSAAAGAIASASASASSTAAATTSFSSLHNGPSQPNQPSNTRELFNDPFTGVPSNPPDVDRLFLICQSDARPMTHSIPASLFFIYHYAQPWSQHRRPFRKRSPQGNRRFLLGCPRNQRISTYTRLFTEWLFSGCAPRSLAKFHRHADGSSSVSFSPKVRACIYVLRLYLQRGYTLKGAHEQIASIFASEASFDISKEQWHNVVIRTEPVEIPAKVWQYAFPTPALLEDALPPLPTGPITVVQTQHFRGVASLLPPLPDDVPKEWTHWTPITIPEYQLTARRRAYEYQRFQSLDPVDTSVAAPMHELNLYREIHFAPPDRRKIDFFSPDTVCGAEEEFEQLPDEAEIAQNPRIQFVRRITQARQIEPPRPGRPRKSVTPAPTKAAPKQTRLRLIAPHRPSTPEQVAAFEEAMESPVHHNEELTDPSSPERNASSEMNQARYMIVEAESLIKKEELEDAGMDTVGFGRGDTAAERLLFNPLDWE